MGDADYLMALELQREFDRELDINENDLKEIEEQAANTKKRVKPLFDVDSDLNCTQNLVHPEWETLDPTPDAHSLFGAFDAKFFQGRLKCVTLEWSKRMYSCAGICYTRKNRLGMAITIRLSEPLLKLRSRKDLVETLLHEMIHAYLSVLGIKEENGGHGPNFKKIMSGINRVAGTNITVYHTFHDEVDIYKTHWWRCNGICQNRKPFFGYVKRTCNRQPGPNDIWWRQHIESCGGQFLKIREPEKKKPIKSDKENAIKPSADIRKFFEDKNKKSGGKSPESTRTITNNKKNNLIWTSTPGKSNYKNLGNVVVLKDVDDENSPPRKTTTVIEGTGRVLGSTNPPLESSTGKNEHERITVRDVWTKKFAATSSGLSSNASKSVDKSKAGGDEKRRKITKENDFIPVETINDDDNTWTEIDDEIMLKEEKHTVIDISSDEENDNNSNADVVQDNTLTKKILPNHSPEERQRQIKQEILDSDYEVDGDENDIDIIDDEYDDNLINISIQLADTSLIDDLFGDDTLLKDFKVQNSVFATNSRYIADSKNDIICCPVCQENLARENFSDHLDGCTGISIKINPYLPSTSKKLIKTSTFNKKTKETAPSKDEVKKILKNVGYNSNEIDDAFNDENSDDDPEPNRRQALLDTSLHACPVCASYVEVTRINEHLDMCLANSEE